MTDRSTSISRVCACLLYWRMYRLRRIARRRAASSTERQGRKPTKLKSMGTSRRRASPTPPRRSRASRLRTPL